MTRSFLEDPYVNAHPENRPFWEAAEEGRFLGKSCESCGKVHWYPRSICPFCGSTRTRWTLLGGRGHVYAFSTLRRASSPYTVAYVQLEEGPIILTNLVEMGATQPAIGMPVKVVFRRTEDGRCAPKFVVID